MTPMAKQLVHRTSANRLTVLGMLAGIVASGAAAKGWWGFALWMWWVNRCFDGLDGIVARLQRPTDFGGFLDIVCDFVVYCSLPFGLAWGMPSDSGMLVVAIYQAVLVLNTVSLFFLSSIMEKRSAGATARSEKTTVTFPVSFVEGAETVVIYTLWLAIPSVWEYLMILFTIAVAANVVQRLQWAMENLK